MFYEDLANSQEELLSMVTRAFAVIDATTRATLLKTFRHSFRTELSPNIHFTPFLSATYHRKKKLKSRTSILLSKIRVTSPLLTDHLNRFGEYAVNMQVDVVDINLAMKLPF